MTQLLVTAICVTYGRTSNVEQAVAMFLAQDYPNKRMIVLNTFPKQTLLGDFSGVDIFNCSVRPESMGHARNMAIELAQNGVIVTADDDDFYHSRHLSTIAQHFTEGIEWVWLDTMFFTEKGKIVKTAVGSPNCFAVTKKLWKEVGGYRPMNVYEDKDFIGRATALKGVRVHVEPQDITFCYGWNNNSWHISGHGADEAGAATSYWKVGELVEQQAAAMLIPTGEVLLKPEMRLNPDEMISDWLVQNNMVAEPGANECCIVLLGRYGDLVNLLPVAKHIADRFGKPFWMVSREFADLFDGVSYVTPWVTDLPPAKINEAVALARKRFKNVLVCQVYGENWQADKLSASYNRESWRLAGFANKFDDHLWQPVFDRRDSGREAVLLKRANPDGRPMLLVNVTRAISSPYDKGKELEAAIYVRFCSPLNLIHPLKLVNIAELKLERIYDVLGLMEKAVALVSIDTSPLHLAAAVDCPTIAIVNDKPWCGTEVRFDNFVRFTYADSVETIIAGMEKELA